MLLLETSNFIVIVAKAGCESNLSQPKKTHNECEFFDHCRKDNRISKNPGHLFKSTWVSVRLIRK